MVDWEKLFDGLFKAVATHGIDPAQVLVFVALLVAALLVSAMGLALWCVLAAIKRTTPSTSASSTLPADSRHIVDILNILKWQDLQGKDSDRIRQLEQRQDDPQRALLGRATRQDRRRGGEDLPVGRRSFRWHRR